MKIARIPLLPNSRFHFGEFKVDVNVGLSSTSIIAHSDTLFSALINSYNIINDAGKMVDAFRDRKLNISSLYYYLEINQQIIYFLPKPVFIDADSKIDGNHKLRNKIKFVSKKIWEQGFNQNEWQNNQKYIILQNEFVLLKEEFDSILPGIDADKIKIFNIIQSPKSPHPQVPERKNDPKDSIFYLTNLEINDNKIKDLIIGFYFIYSSSEEFEIQLRDAVNVLAKSGIGGEKNNMGRTMGDPQFDEFHLDLESENFTNVSVVSPANYSDFQNISLYKSFIRGGRKTSSGGGYKVVRMIKEGALVSNKLEGKLIIIGTDDNNNDALRNGLAYLLPVKTC